MRRTILAGLLSLALLQPPIIGTPQSPIASPEPALTSPLTPPSPPETGGPIQFIQAVSPVIWIFGGLILGGLIILVVQRTSSTDGR